MSENILVVEYEPRYTDRVRQALQGQPFMPMFARDGEEAIRALDGEQPRLIVLSSVVPKVSTTELIRTIRGRNSLQQTPILLTVSGYNGKSPKADAQRVGASDILPKPYSETEFLGKIQQMLGVRSDAPAATQQLTSNEIFGELLEDDKPARKADRGTGDVDKMLADTLAGVMPSRRKEPTQAGNVPVPPPPPAQAGRAKTGPGSAELDKILHDTLSGLEKKKTVTGAPVPQPPQAAAPAPASAPAAAPVPAAPQQPPEASRFATDRLSAYVPDRVPVSQPVFPQPVAQPKLEEDDARDGVRFGQYVLLEKIATGGMAEVWKARMRGVEGFQKIVAIKKILPHLSDNQDFIEMFVDEAKLAAQLNHNNIIHIYDLGKIQSSYYIAMEYIDGFDLKTILRLGQEHDNPMNVELALFVGSKVASALDYAHRKKDFEEKEMGLVHRDVSPQNVLISQEGDIKLCDFGIAKAASKASHTQAGALKGKLQYMSPEQAWGKHIDRRSDVFALAAVLFELLTSKKLFSGDNEISILEQVREARVQPPSLYNDEVTPEIDRIVLKALQKEPADRYQTAGEMARDLDAVLYSFRPTPTSADLAIYMHRLSSPETVVEAEPEPERPAAAAALPQPPVISPVKLPAPPVINTSAAPAAAVVTPVAAPIPAAAPAAAAPTYGDIPEPVKRKSSAGLIIAAVVALAVIGGAAFFFLRQPAAAPAATAAKSSVAPAPPTQTAPLTAASTTTDLTSTAATGTLAATATTASIDPSLVDAEVQKRIAAERTRLEALARAQQQTQTTAPLRPVPAPVQQAAQQQPAPAPAPQETRPAPAPVVQETAAPAPQVAETRPAAPAPVVQRAKEGDLVPPGTEGLTAPRMTRRGTVQYPPLARTQKIEGTVITSVLVSERGDVLEVRILRGVNRPGGLNEAAIQAMRRSSFAAGMKDGVRVKAWLTVPVEFKL